MVHETTFLERLLHLALFALAGLTFGVAALALVERVAGGGRALVRPWHVAGAAAATLLVFGLERLYHAL